jgi:Secretion system C-terminal sorting domain/PA domain
MKQFNAVKQLLMIVLLGATFSVQGQIHPLAFGATGVTTNTNWYKDYVGLRFEVTSPSAVAGDKIYTTAYSGTAPWGGQVTTPLVNVPVAMDTTADSFGGSAFPAGRFTGKIAMLWRGPMGSGAVFFACKALHAQQAGAVACVIINEYPGQGPVGMAADASCPGITIPVFMIGNLDGIALSSQYWSGQPVKMTITPWGLGLRNDIGFVPGGAAAWHAYAMPSDQFVPGSTLPGPLKGLDGAFIANYGSSDAKNVKVAASLYYTKTGGVKTLLHTDTAAGEATFTGLAHSPASDSIIAMFTTPEYSFAPAAIGTGKYDLVYTISSDTANQNVLDTSLTMSFYSSDSVYSKGRYDFTTNGPVATQFEGPGGGTSDFVWGNMFYIAHGRDAVRSIQFSLYNTANTTGDITSGPMNFYVLKWVDGSGGQPMDSVVQNGELEIVSTGTYAFKPGDTSGMIFKLPYMVDPVSGQPGVSAPWLDSNSWFYVAAETSAGYFLGVDGGNSTDPYPRLYGRAHVSNYLEYQNFEWNGDYSGGITANPTANNAPVSFPGALGVFSVDSFTFANQKGLIPAVAMIVTKTPDTSKAHVSVPGVVKPIADVSLYPNPADNYINVSVSMDKPAHTVRYTILDGLARFVSKETHYDVQNETYQMSTSKLAAGSYFLVINIDDKIMTRKFTVVR